jgi:O-antigen ligase
MRPGMTTLATLEGCGLSFAAIGAGAYILGLAIPSTSDIPFLVLLFFAALSLAFEFRKAPAARPAGLIFVSLFVVSFTLSTTVSVDVTRSLSLSVPLLPAGLVFFLIAGQFRSLAQVRITLFSFSIVSVVVPVLLILKVIADPGGNPSAWIGSLGSPFFVVPNDLLFLSITAPVSMVLFRAEKNLFVRATAISAIVLSILAISLYQSRTGILTMLISMAVCAWLLRPRLALLGAGAIILLGLLADGLLGFPLLAKFGSIAGHRFALWLAAWNIFLDAPLLGHGPHSFGLLVNSYVYDVQLPDRGVLKNLVEPWHPGMHSPWAHNLYLETLASQGILGLIALLALLAGALNLGWKMRRSTDETARFYGIAILSGLVGFCVAGVYELSFIRIWVPVVLFSYVALLACLYRFHVKMSKGQN